MTSSNGRPDGDYAYEQVRQIAARALSLARYYTALLLEWRPAPAPAMQFRDTVLRPLEREDFDAALSGLDAWLRRWYDTDPLMRDYCVGIKTQLRVGLVTLTAPIDFEY